MLLDNALKDRNRSFYVHALFDDFAKSFGGHLRNVIDEFQQIFDDEMQELRSIPTFEGDIEYLTRFLEEGKENYRTLMTHRDPKNLPANFNSPERLLQMVNKYCAGQRNRAVMNLLRRIEEQVESEHMNHAAFLPFSWKRHAVACVIERSSYDGMYRIIFMNSGEGVGQIDVTYDPDSNLSLTDAFLTIDNVSTEGLKFYIQGLMILIENSAAVMFYQIILKTLVERYDAIINPYATNNHAYPLQLSGSCSYRGVYLMFYYYYMIQDEYDTSTDNEYQLVRFRIFDSYLTTVLIQRLYDRAESLTEDSENRSYTSKNHTINSMIQTKLNECEKVVRSREDYYELHSELKAAADFVITKVGAVKERGNDFNRAYIEHQRDNIVKFGFENENRIVQREGSRPFAGVSHYKKFMGNAFDNYYVNYGGESRTSYEHMLEVLKKVKENTIDPYQQIDQVAELRVKIKTIFEKEVYSVIMEQIMYHLCLNFRSADAQPIQTYTVYCVTLRNVWRTYKNNTDDLCGTLSSQDVFKYTFFIIYRQILYWNIPELEQIDIGNDSIGPIFDQELLFHFSENNIVVNKIQTDMMRDIMQIVSEDTRYLIIKDEHLNSLIDISIPTIPGGSAMIDAVISIMSDDTKLKRVLSAYFRCDGYRTTEKARCESLVGEVAYRFNNVRDTDMFKFIICEIPYTIQMEDEMNVHNEIFDAMSKFIELSLSMRTMEIRSQNLRVHTSYHYIDTHDFTLKFSPGIKPYDNINQYANQIYITDQNDCSGNQIISFLNWLVEGSNIKNIDDYGDNIDIMNILRGLPKFGKFDMGSTPRAEPDAQNIANNADAMMFGNFGRGDGLLSDGLVDLLSVVCSAYIKHYKKVDLKYRLLIDMILFYFLNGVGMSDSLAPLITSIQGIRDKNRAYVEEVRAERDEQMSRGGIGTTLIDNYIGDLLLSIVIDDIDEITTKNFRMIINMMRDDLDYGRSGISPLIMNDKKSQMRFTQYLQQIQKRCDRNLSSSRAKVSHTLDHDVHRIGRQIMTETGRAAGSGGRTFDRHYGGGKSLDRYDRQTGGQNGDQNGGQTGGQNGGQNGGQTGGQNGGHSAKKLHITRRMALAESKFSSIRYDNLYDEVFNFHYELIVKTMMRNMIYHQNPAVRSLVSTIYMSSQMDNVIVRDPDYRSISKVSDMSSITDFGIFDQREIRYRNYVIHKKRLNGSFDFDTNTNYSTLGLRNTTNESEIIFQTGDVTFRVLKNLNKTIKYSSGKGKKKNKLKYLHCTTVNDVDEVSLKASARTERRPLTDLLSNLKITKTIVSPDGFEQLYYLIPSPIFIDIPKIVRSEWLFWLLDPVNSAADTSAIILGEPINPEKEFCNSYLLFEISDNDVVIHRAGGYDSNHIEQDQITNDSNDRLMTISEINEDYNLSQFLSCLGSISEDTTEIENIMVWDGGNDIVLIEIPELKIRFEYHPQEEPSRRFRYGGYYFVDKIPFTIQKYHADVKNFFILRDDKYSYKLLILNYVVMAEDSIWHQESDPTTSDIGTMAGMETELIDIHYSGMFVETESITAIVAYHYYLLQSGNMRIPIETFGLLKNLVSMVDIRDEVALGIIIEYIKSLGVNYDIPYNALFAKNYGDLLNILASKIRSYKIRFELGHFADRDNRDSSSFHERAHAYPMEYLVNMVDIERGADSIIKFVRLSFLHFAKNRSISLISEAPTLNLESYNLDKITPPLGPNDIYRNESGYSNLPYNIQRDPTNRKKYTVAYNGRSRYGPESGSIEFSGREFKEYQNLSDYDDMYSWIGSMYYAINLRQIEPDYNKKEDRELILINAQIQYNIMKSYEDYLYEPVPTSRSSISTPGHMTVPQLVGHNFKREFDLTLFTRTKLSSKQIRVTPSEDGLVRFNGIHNIIDIFKIELADVSAESDLPSTLDDKFRLPAIEYLQSYSETDHTLVRQDLQNIYAISYCLLYYLETNVVEPLHFAYYGDRTGRESFLIDSIYGSLYGGEETEEIETTVDRLYALILVKKLKELLNLIKSVIVVSDRSDYDRVCRRDLTEIDSLVSDVIERNRDDPSIPVDQAVLDKVTSKIREIPLFGKEIDTHSIFVLYEFIFGNFMRESQKNVIQQILQDNAYEGADYGAGVAGTDVASGQHASKLYQLLMGEGKSSVIVPILSLMLSTDSRFERIVIITPESLVKQTAGTVVRYLGNLYQGDMMALELSRGGVSPDLAKDVIGNCLVIVSDVTMKSAILNQQLLNNRQSVSGRERFELDRTALICDEIDDLMDPIKSELNFPLGNKKPLEEAPLIFKILYGLIQTTIFGTDNWDELEPIHQRFIVQGRANNIPHFHLTGDDNILSEPDITAIIIRTLNNILGREIPYIGELIPPMIEGREELTRFMDERRDDYDFDYEIIRIVKNCLVDTLPGLMKFIHRRHYGLIDTDRVDFKNNKKGLFAIPFKAANTPDDGSEYSDHYFTIGLTIMSFLDPMAHRLRKQDLMFFIKYIHSQALEGAGSGALNFYEEQYKRIIEGVEPLELGDPKFSELTSEDWATLSRNEYATRLYLTEIMKLITVNRSQLTASFYDVLAPRVTPYRIGFTGTPFVKLPKFEPHPITEIVDRPIDYGSMVMSILGMNEKEKPKILPLADDRRSVVDRLLEIAASYDALIDVGSFIITESPYDVAIKLLRILGPYGKHYVVFIDNDDVKYYIEAGSNLERKRFLNNLPLDEIFVYYDQKHITGTDIPQKLDALALVTIRMNNTFRDAVQGIYRMRKINKGQTIDFTVFPNSMAKFESNPNMEILNLLDGNQRSYENGQTVLAKVQNMRTLIYSNIDPSSSHRNIKSFGIPYQSDLRIQKEDSIDYVYRSLRDDQIRKLEGEMETMRGDIYDEVIDELTAIEGDVPDMFLSTVQRQQEEVGREQQREQQREQRRERQKERVIRRSMYDTLKELENIRIDTFLESDYTSHFEADEKIGIFVTPKFWALTNTFGEGIRECPHLNYGVMINSSGQILIMTAMEVIHVSGYVQRNDITSFSVIMYDSYPMIRGDVSIELSEEQSLIIKIMGRKDITLEDAFNIIINFDQKAKSFLSEGWTTRPGINYQILHLFLSLPPQDHLKYIYKLIVHINEIHGMSVPERQAFDWYDHEQVMLDSRILDINKLLGTERLPLELIDLIKRVCPDSLCE
jgi:Protein of unknown function (DUF3638)